MMRILFVVILNLFVLSISAQDQVKQTEAMNAYIEYMNKSAHGLFVIHKLLEIENQGINKYADLESFELNNFKNSDISSNVFTDKQFYERELGKSQKNPYELMEIAIGLSKELPVSVADKWNKKAKEIKKVLVAANQIRFDIENYVGSHNLNNIEDLEGAYEVLEQAKTLYTQFYMLQSDFYLDLKKYHQAKCKNIKNKDLVEAMDKVHLSSKLILDALRFKNDNSFEGLLSDLEKANSEYKAVSKNYAVNPKYSRTNLKKHFKNIQGKIESTITSSRDFYDAASVPTEYKQYGKYYHYHNNMIVSHLDWFGNGFVSEMNELIKILNTSSLNYIDVPLFFKVIYPEKIDSTDEIVSSDPLIDKIPTKIKKRKVRSSKFVIDADSDVIVLNLFDYKIQDGDIVSINFNGDWILENHSIETKASELTLKLNPDGKNYLLLHAESVGRRPPNTMGIKYTYKGEERELELKSDLDNSELIEIRSH